MKELNGTRDELTRRIERVERQNRWLARIIVLLGMAVLLFVALAANSEPAPQGQDEAAQQVIKAQGFLLVDDEGKTVCKVYGHLGGQRGFYLVGPDGKMKVELVVTKEGIPGMVFYGGEKGGGIGFSTLGNGASDFRFYDLEGNVRLRFGLEADGSPYLRMTDEEGNLVFSAP